MKKWLCIFVTCALLISVGSFAAAEEPSAENPDVLMLYDGERDDGNGFENPWGQGAGHDQDNFTEGTSGYAVQSFSDGLMFFQNTFNYHGKTLDVSNYEYIEFDLYSYYNMICDLELCVCSNIVAHHGNDCEMFEVFLPAEKFVHVKMPLSSFVVHSLENRDKYDETEDKKGDPEEDWEHYSGESLNKVARLRWQFTYCTYTDGTPCDDIYMVFDNVTATRNGAGSEQTIQYWADVKDEFGDTSSTEPSEPSSPSKPSDPSKPNPPATIVYGNLDNDPKINAGDALYVLRAAVNKLQLSEAQKQAADVNDDGKINATDALLILQFAVGKITKFPVETK